MRTLRIVHREPGSLPAWQKALLTVAAILLSLVLAITFVDLSAPIQVNFNLRSSKPNFGRISFKSFILRRAFRLPFM